MLKERIEMRLRVVLGIILTALFVGTLALAFNIQPVKADPKTTYVDDDNTLGPWDGTLEHPYQNITSALQHASVNDTIYVYNGTYYEHVVVNKTVSLIGENRSTTIIDGGGTGRVVKLDAGNAVVRGFTIRNGGYGVFIDSNQVYDGYHNNTISGNTITGNKWHGLYIFDSGYNNISYNIVSNNTKCGIILMGVAQYGGNTIFDNKILDNGQAMSIGQSLGDDPNILKGNEMIGNRYGLEICDGHHSTYTVVDTSNTVDGKPVYYLINESNLVIDPSTFPEIGYLGVANSTNITIRDLTLSKSGRGICIADSENVTILNVTVSNNRVGISAESIGFKVNCSILNSKILNNQYGIGLTCSSHSTIQGNTVSNNTIGIGIGGMSSGNLITNNSISNSKEYGIYIYYWCTGGNILYHNNFIDNTNQVYREYTPNPDTWDNGYPSGGNYWSDYAGVDVKSGPNQDQPSSDGIGDTAYVIDADNIDHYPLMYPWGTSPPPSYTLRVYSSPAGVTFTVDNVSRTTPWSGTYTEGTSVSLVMPETHDGYAFSHWLEDEDTNRTKTVTMDTNLTLTAVYAPPMPVGGIYIPVNKFELLVPYIESTILLAVAVITVAYVKKRKRNTEIIS